MHEPIIVAQLVREDFGPNPESVLEAGGVVRRIWLFKGSLW
jgi:hypothetical protein